MAYVRKTHSDDVYELVGVLRAADRVELEAAGVDPLEALENGYLYSFPYCWTIVHGGEPIAMFGVVPIRPRIGAVWLLGSDGIVKIRRQFLTECRKWLETIESGYDALLNRVHEENHVHIRWLRWMGFTLYSHQSPFIHFAKLCVNQSPLGLHSGSPQQAMSPPRSDSIKPHEPPTSGSSGSTP